MSMSATAADPESSARVVLLCSQLIARDSSNYGADGSSGEREVAEYIATTLREVGYEPIVAESADRRSNVLVRVAGQNPQLSALLVHGHLDVVPAEAEQWSVDPFSGLVKDGYIWGRGACDMKDMVASMIETLLTWRETGVAPRRDVVFVFVADEEADGEFGSEWLVSEHPEWFSGVVAAIGEGGGAPIEQQGAAGEAVRIYPVATAERGIQHMRLTARGTSGHGSRTPTDSAVVHLIDALGRIVHHRWPLWPSDATLTFLRGALEALGMDADLASDDGIERAMSVLNEDLVSCVRSASRCSANPTVLRAGYKVNVTPGIATAELDARTVPGTERDFLAQIDELLGPHVTREFLTDQAGIAAPLDSEWFDAIRRTLIGRDPDAHVLPFCLGGGTDGKAFARLGIACYGFAPLGANPSGPIADGEHGVDERVSVSALVEGARVLRDFLTSV